MIKDIISFMIGHKNFAVDLKETPLIVSANKYLPIDLKFNNHSYYFRFENKNIKLINLHTLLGFEFDKITQKTKILIGYKDKDNYYGILADEVKSIINLKANVLNNNLNNKNDKQLFWEEKEINGKKLFLINSDSNLFKNQILEMEKNDV